MFEKPTVFIASSNRARLLAETLAEVLNEKHALAQAWTSQDAFPISTGLLSQLLKLSRSQDFAVVIFTGDDVQGSGQDVLRVPRDNCIFELGLFIGAFDTAERCFLLVSKQAEKSLKQLSDLGGLRYEPFDPPDFENPDECLETAKSYAEKVMTMIDRKKRFLDRPRLVQLTTDELLELESRRDELLSYSTVIVKERQPPERELRYAKVVCDNMIERKIRYHYLFTPRRGNYPQIVLMLRSLIAISVLEPSKYDHFTSQTEEKQKQYLAGKAKKLRPVIAEVGTKLFISFTNKQRFDEFCIHSAADPRRRKGFLKIGNGYAPMLRETVNRRSEEYRIDDREPIESVFAPGELKGEDRKRFKGYVREIFPKEMYQAALVACFGKQDSAG